MARANVYPYNVPAGGKGGDDGAGGAEADKAARGTDGAGAKPDVEHSDDFRSVLWYGTEYSFTANQAPVIRLLYEHWQRGTPDVGDETLLESVDHELPPARFSTLFRDSKAWKTIIVAGETRGTHRRRPPKA